MTQRPGFLAPYRVLDLTDERGLLAGHMLAQLGADVIQVEPPAGSPARRAGPLDADAPVDQRSFVWAAYAAGKRSITCDLDSERGRAMFRQLVAQADFLIECERPGALAARGLDFARLRELNPALVHVSITPFGSDGPKALWAASDLVLWAAGGPLLQTQDSEERAPLRISVPQAWLHAAADAAGGALVAHFARVASGRGQHVDISVQQSVAQATLSTVLAAPVGHENYSLRLQPRHKLRKTAERAPTSKWVVRDGLVEMPMTAGPVTGPFTNNLFAWLHEEGVDVGDAAAWDWVTLQPRIDSGEIGDDALARLRDAVARVLAPRTKAELVDIAMGRKLLLAPVATSADLATSPHHLARGFLQTVTDDDGRQVLLPGPFALGAPQGFVPLTPAPRIGQHDDAVSAEWLGRPARSARSDGRHIDDAARGGGDPMNAPFAGLKVLDLAWVVAGPVIGRALADFGATVVRVESSRRVETARVMGPFPGAQLDVQQSGLFENCNAGKLGLTLDLASPQGRDVVRDLVRWADVLVESFSPGQMQRWGLGFDALRELNPGLVMLSTSLMGQSGPYASFAGYGNVGAAFAGFQQLVGWPGEQPVGPFGPYTDYVGPRFSLVALLAALDQRRRTGEGCHLDVSQAEAGMQFLAPQIADFSLTGRVAQPQGNRDPDMAPHGVFRCRRALPQGVTVAGAAAGEGQVDGGHPAWIAIAVRSDAQWRALASLIGGEALAADARYATRAGRQAHEAALEALIDAWSAPREAHALAATLQAQGVAAHVAMSSLDLIEDPQLQAREHFIALDHPLMGTSTVEAARYRLSETPGGPTRCAPTLGRDNTLVLSELLGYSDEHIAALASAGVLK